MWILNKGKSILETKVDIMGSTGAPSCGSKSLEKSTKEIEMHGSNLVLCFCFYFFCTHLHA